MVEQTTITILEEIEDNLGGLVMHYRQPTASDGYIQGRIIAIQRAVEMLRIELGQGGKRYSEDLTLTTGE